ncbi:MAG: TIGR00725 family protein, partial [Candidatus Thermoplasmatota archaeon]|nr:TIGR00725 family protein [Candidatus Thermoplasmatota archaeon]
MSKRPQRIGTYLNIGVIGGSQPELKYAEIAYDVGKLLALKGAVLICGGLSGIMASAAKGAYEAGGITVGILPGLSAGEGNEFLSVRIPTGIGYARNFLIVRASDALVAIDGSNGTISEASFAIAEGKTVVFIC